MLHRRICFAGVLALGSCGGLAADGRDELTPEPEPQPGGASPPTFIEPDHTEPDHSEPDYNAPGTPRAAPSAPDAPRVGDVCEPGSEGVERVVIGEIVLEASAHCGAGRVCLMRAGDDPECALSTDTPGCPVLDRDDEFVPVPPSLAPGRPPLDRVCTCRCAGGDGDQCQCPEGMACRELIRSAGANGAAADFVGSYCLY